MDAKLLFLHALTPLHTGTGQGVGVIDQPIARETATGIPYVPGSSLKGVLRDSCELEESVKIQVFGPDTGSAETHAGAVNFTDLRLLLLPVRSLNGVFAWVTSPLLLQRMLRDGKTANRSSPPGGALPEKDNVCFVASQDSHICQTQHVVLEDLLLKSDVSEIISQWAQWLGDRIFPENEGWQKILKDRLCLVSDDIMSFLMETGTEVIARIALESDKKTAKDGALWYEESLSAETILTGMVVATAVKKSGATPEAVFSTVSTIIKKPLQIGGSATVGRGICQLQMLDKEPKSIGEETS